MLALQPQAVEGALYCAKCSINFIDPGGGGFLDGMSYTILIHSYNTLIIQGCQREVIKKEELHFVANLAVNYRYR